MAKTRGKSTRPSVITPIGDITGGVDTHKDFHVAAAVDSIGRTLGTEKFPATAAGYGELLAWLRGFGPLALIGVEGTGSYGAGLSTHLTGQPTAARSGWSRSTDRTGRNDASAASPTPRTRSTPHSRHWPAKPPRPRNPAPAR